MADIGHTLSPISPLAHDHGSNSLSALSDTDPNASLHNVCCGGCKNPIESEGGGGVVVAFGSALWHVDCFQCAKCHQRVNADTNLLLLSDGSPVCSNCSYNCNICKLPILDEAIMTGDDSYHAACFTCRSCSRRIEELVFAKTTQGIYCMDCHNERVARSRRHAEKRSKSKGASSSSRREKERPREPRPSHSDRDGSTQAIEFPQGQPSPPATPQSPNISIEPHQDHPADHPYPNPTAAKRLSTQLMYHQDQRSHYPLSNPPTIAASPTSPHPPPIRPAVDRAFSSETISSQRAAARSPVQDGSSSGSSSAFSPSHQHRDHRPPALTLQNHHHQPPYQTPTQNHNHPNAHATPQETLPIPTIQNPPDSRRRRSFNDGVRLDAPMSAPSSSPTTPRAGRMSPTVGTGPGLNVPTSKADKRRSISPGLWLSSGTASNVEGPRSPPTGSDGLLSPHANLSAYDTTTPRANGSNGMGAGQLNESTNLKMPGSPGSGSPLHSGSQPSSRSGSPAAPQPPISAVPASGPTILGNGHPSALSASTMQRALPPRTKSLPENREAEDGGAQKGGGSNGDAAGAPKKAPIPAALRLSSATNSSSDVPPTPPPKLSPPDSIMNATISYGDAPDQPEDDDTLVLSAGHAEPPDVPALPPMRFSLNATDFSNLLMSVETPPSGKNDVSRRPTIDTVLSSETESSSVSLLGSVASLVPAPEPVPLPIIVHQTGDSSVETEGSSDSSPSQIHNAQDPSRLGLSSSISDSHSSHLLTSLSTNNNSTTSLLSASPGARRQEPSDLVLRRLREAITDVTDRGSTHVKLDREFVEAIVRVIEGTREKVTDMRGVLDQAKRASLQYITGLTVAHDEYSKELAGRRDAEAEVTRLRVQLSGQAARLTAMSAPDRQRDVMERMLQDLNTQTRGLERDVAKLKVDRDQALAELEEISKANKTGASPESLPRALAHQMDNIKTRYRGELEPLQHQREALMHEINELKEARDIFLEETTALNARNDELAQLNGQIARQIETSIPTSFESSTQEPAENGAPKPGTKPAVVTNPFSPMSKQQHKAVPSPASMSSIGSTLAEERSIDSASSSVGKKFKWFGASAKSLPSLPEKTKRAKQHTFQQQSILRFTRCDHCGDKLWGAQFRCSDCSMTCHPRCVNHISAGCVQSNAIDDSLVEVTPLPPSMFGRDLVEQVHADEDRGGDGLIPVIVDKCIRAVEVLGMDYEGIYRKTGGSGQSKAITQLFERGDYDTFDLEDSDTFNDISSVTSVLKTYFRNLPNPLLSHALHESFIAAIGIKDQRDRFSAMSAVVTELPVEHYYTLRHLMFHLHRVQARADQNRMNSRNLGVVFGPTLMRSADASAEFADMAGKALSIEWMVDNALDLFPNSTP